MSWASNRTADNKSAEYERFIREDEAEQERQYAALASDLEAMEGNNRYTPQQIQRVRNQMNAIAAAYPHILARVMAKALGKIAEIEEGQARREYAGELVTKKDELGLDGEEYDKATDFPLDDDSTARYLTAMNAALAQEPLSEFYIGNTEAGQRNAALLGGYIRVNGMSPADPRSWRLAFKYTVGAMTPIKALPQPEPEKKPEPKVPRVFTQTVMTKTPWGTTEPQEWITGAEYYLDGKRIRMSAEEVNKLLEEDPAEYKRRFRPTQGINIPAAMR
jgi:hypothetical protein